MLRLTSVIASLPSEGCMRLYVLTAVRFQNTILCDDAVKLVHRWQCYGGSTALAFRPYFCLEDGVESSCEKFVDTLTHRNPRPSVSDDRKLRQWKSHRCFAVCD